MTSHSRTLSADITAPRTAPCQITRVCDVPGFLRGHRFSVLCLICQKVRLRELCVRVCDCPTHTYTHSECSRLTHNSNRGFDTRMDYVIWRSCSDGAVCFGSLSSYKSLLACKAEVGESNMSFHCLLHFLVRTKKQVVSCPEFTKWSLSKPVCISLRPTSLLNLFTVSRSPEEWGD